MKRVILLFAAVLLASIGWSQTVTLKFKNGTKQQYNMSEIESIEFSEGDNTSEDDDISGDAYFDDTEYCQLFINGEECTEDFYGGGILVLLRDKEIDGTDFYAYGGMTDQIKISPNDGLQYHIVAGYVSTDFKTVIPHPVGTYKVLSSRGESPVNDYTDDLGMMISGGNMNHRTVTSGSLNITKVNKYKISTSMPYQLRTIAYVSEGTFDFVLTDDWDGNENHIIGKFRIVF